MSAHDDLTPEEAAELFFGDFSAALFLFEEVASRLGEIRARPGEFSHTAARGFAEGLILDPTVDAARQRIQSDRLGAVSFYEMAHGVSDRLRAKQFQFVQRSDGQHEPFLLLASAVLNLLDWVLEHDPDEYE
jgi:hypothetical protein